MSMVSLALRRPYTFIVMALLIVLATPLVLRNMATDSAWLAALRDREGRRSHDPYRAFTCLFTYHDNLVTPQHNAVLPGARQIALSGIGHLSLALSPRVIGHVVAEIARMSNAVRAVAGAGDSSSGA